MLSSCLSVALLALAAPALPGTVPISLGDTLRRSVRDNLEVDVARRQIGYWNAVAEAGWARFVPTLKLQGSYRSEAYPAMYSLLPFPWGNSIFVTNTAAGSLSVGGVVPWLGTRYEFKSGAMQLDTDDVTQLIAPLHRLAFDFTLSQPLWKGVGPINEIATRQARLEGRAAEAVLDRATLDAALAAARDYVKLQAAQLRLESQQKARDLARSLAALTDELIETGRLPPSASAAQQVLVSLKEQQVEAAGVELESAQETFAEALEEKGLTRFVATDPLDPVPVSLSASEAVHLALAASPELAVQERELAVAKLDLERRHDDLRPDLELEAGAESFGESGTLRCQNGFFTDGITPCVVPPIMAGGWSQAALLALQGRFGNYGAGLTFSMPLDLGPLRSALSAAEAQVAIRKDTLEHLRRKLELQAAGRVALLQSMASTLAAARRALDTARRSVDVAQEAYRNRRITSLDLVRAQEVLSQARDQEIESAERLAVANLELLALTGRLVPPTTAQDQ